MAGSGVADRNELWFFLAIVAYGSQIAHVQAVQSAEYCAVGANARVGPYIVAGTRCPEYYEQSQWH